MNRFNKKVNVNAQKKLEIM